MLSLALISALALAQGDPANTLVYSRTALGYSAAVNLSTNPTASVRMSGPSGYYTRASFIMAIVWGSSTSMNVTCAVSGDGTNFGTLQRCTSASPHDCGVRTWQWTPADGTDATLDFEGNYPYLRCTFAATGTGTIQVHAVLGK